MTRGEQCHQVTRVVAPQHAGGVDEIRELLLDVAIAESSRRWSLLSSLVGALAKNRASPAAPESAWRSFSFPWSSSLQEYRRPDMTSSVSRR